MAKILAYCGLDCGECEAYVVRRGFDGTATVELRWQSEGNQEMRRRILFVMG